MYIYIGLVAFLPNFLFTRINCSCAWRKLSINSNQLSWAPLASRAISHRTLPGRSLKTPKFTLQSDEPAFYSSPSPQDPELHHLMLTVAKVALSFTFPTVPSWVQVQQSIAHSWSLLTPLLLERSYQKPPGLLMSCCIVPPANI